MPGVSTLTTSAPISASIPVQNGPARMRVRSTTRIPDNGTRSAPRIYWQFCFALYTASRRKPGSTYRRPRRLKNGSRLSPGRGMRDASPAMKEITPEDIECLAVGAWILGTGGGGSPYLGLLNMRRLYAEGHRVPLMSPLDLDDEDRVAVVSNMGAPLVGQERLADSRNIARAVEMQQEIGGFKFRAVMSLEIGGGNGTQALMAAAHLGLPVVDADLMGRAYPEAQMTSVAVGDLRPYPCALYDPRGL